MSNFKEWSAEFQGDDVEQAYAEVFGTKVIGGFNDKGKDIETGDKEIPFLQIKSSVEGAKSFLAESLKRKKFIPIAIGEPGTKEEMLATIKEYGGWIGKDEPDRKKILEGIAQIKILCGAGK